MFNSWGCVFRLGAVDDEMMMTFSLKGFVPFHPLHSMYHLAQLYLYYLQARNQLQLFQLYLIEKEDEKA